MTIIYPDKEKLKEVLREEVWWQFSQAMKDLVDEDIPKVYELYDNAKWTRTAFTIPAGTPAGYSPQARSRRSYMYPELIAYGTWPDIINQYPEIGSVYLGFEHGGGVYYGSAFFQLGKTGSTLWMNARVAGKGDYGKYLNILNLMPSDFQTKRHYYTVKINRCNVEFFVDGKLVAVIISSPFMSDLTVSEEHQPYAIGLTNGENPISMDTLLEVALESSPSSDIVLDFPAYGFKISSGDPLPARIYRLYQWETENLLAGLTLTSGSVTSHPVPVFGYRDKTIFFQADQSGTVDIEVLTQTGNWRTYYSDTVSADELWWLKMTGDAVLARLTYTPTAYPATIVDAEVVLNG